MVNPKYCFQATVKKEVSPLVNECNSIEEMVDKLESEKLEAINGNKYEEQRKKVTELEKVRICRTSLHVEGNVENEVIHICFELATRVLDLISHVISGSEKIEGFVAESNER